MRRSGPLRLLFVPDRFRAFVRQSELGLVLLGAISGVIAGLVVVAMTAAVRLLHEWIFRIGAGERLSSAAYLDRTTVLLAPVAGGLILGIVVYILVYKRKRPMVDPIEANALHGGRLSLTDSIIICVQNVISNGFGASVGLEAGYTQLSSGFASKIGIALKLRRGDLRILVGCGAAGAIAAAFNAPLTGAFYAFELIIGSYAISSLTPVIAASLLATTVARLFIPSGFLVNAASYGSVIPTDYMPALLLGLLCAGGGILLMTGVSKVEEAARHSAIPPSVRPVVGGMVVGLLAFWSPQVLSGGHGALHLNLDQDMTIPALAFLLLMKSLASAVSIGSGFRGGLFFASLFLGALFGKIYALTGMWLFPGTVFAPTVYAIIGMSCLAASVIGGPLTMTFLALEVTGDFSITALTLAAVITASLTVRNLFGYSFATWRFHLRGESIRSAHDVGWIRNLTVDKLMRPDVKTAYVTGTLARFRESFPLGSTQRVVIVDEAGKYVGIVLVAEAHASDVANGDGGIADLIRYKTSYLLPTMNAKQATKIFEAAESEALAVVNDRIEQRVIGLLSESYTLRRYSEELDKRRRELSGET
ncbi:chloride channel protein [Rhizobiaceae bacterium n13]|uniref:Chloride channel protein n=1 Tax=Ferirhizobium litorale TaxID=2927786 RepID=A0AAE3Q946_9HYPH|nr:chloride channel protein [Fererhizobium litorale]MDI7861385.1 chloride channel protein [Fererhizobium litorale]MDI7921532.1 chloride channel protein [Fererhizobium litorale]